jgi:hypothetical protein
MTRKVVREGYQSLAFFEILLQSPLKTLRKTITWMLGLSVVELENI